MAGTDYSKLSDAELEKANQKEMALRTESGERSELIVAERSRRAAEARARDLIEGMSDGDRAIFMEVARASASASSPGGDE